MFSKINNSLYLKKADKLYKQGHIDGKIIPYNDEFYERLSHTYISDLPVFMHIKYFRPNIPPMRCLDRSLYMFLALNEIIHSKLRYALVAGVMFLIAYLVFFLTGLAFRHILVVSV